MMSCSGTPNTSAAIWAKTVSDPVPRSVAPTRRLKEPSSLILMLAPPISRPGMAVPCIHIAAPRPRRKWGFPGTSRQAGSSLRSQPIAFMPCSKHSFRPQD